MKNPNIRGIVPLLGLLVPFLVLGFVLKKSASPIKCREINDMERLIFY